LRQITPISSSVSKSGHEPQNSQIYTSGSASSTLKGITKNPALFPFATESISIKGLESHGRLEVLHQGLDEDVIMLRGGGAKGRFPAQYNDSVPFRIQRE
jgi:hypothetical protein